MHRVLYTALCQVVTCMCVKMQLRATEAAAAETPFYQNLSHVVTCTCVKMQLELSETRGRLRATEAAAAESSGRVESLAARLAAAHNAKPIGMIWQNPSQASLVMS